jgi:very-short-patch-repair endonuclease
MPSSEASHETARRLRREQTPAEQVLWRHLRTKRMCNVKFRRQHPIGPYFVDFCSIQRQLIVEIDGSQHADQSAEDEVRSSFLKSYGYRVLRFWNNQVLENTDEVLVEIEKFLSTDSSESLNRARKKSRAEQGPSP